MYLNGIRYQFDTVDNTPEENRIQIKENNDFRTHAIGAGLSDTRANIVSTISLQIMRNMGDSDTIDPAQLAEMYSREAEIFGEPMIRENIYKLYSQKLVLDAEHRDLKKRYDEIL